MQSWPIHVRRCVEIRLLCRYVPAYAVLKGNLRNSGGFYMMGTFIEVTWVAFVGFVLRVTGRS